MTRQAQQFVVGECTAKFNAHLRRTIRILYPSLRVLFPAGIPSVVVPLRPSSEHILIVRAPGAVGRHTDFLNRSFPLRRGWPG